MTTGFCGRVIALAWLLSGAVVGGDVTAASATTNMDPVASAAPAQPLGPAAHALLVSPDRGRQPVDDAVLMLEDPSGTLDLAAVRTRSVTDWKVPSRLPLNIGYSRSSWWLHLRLRNADSAPLDRLFEVGSALQDYVDISVVRGDGRLERYVTLGDRVPFANRPVQSVNPTVPLRLAARDARSVPARVGPRRPV